MGQYEVRHQTDRTCASCIYYEAELVQDSFGPMIEEYCAKGQYGHVGYYAEACKDYKED